MDGNLAMANHIVYQTEEQANNPIYPFKRYYFENGIICGNCNGEGLQGYMDYCRACGGKGVEPIKSYLSRSKDKIFAGVMYKESLKRIEFKP